MSSNMITLSDVTLELMQANETLEKVESNTLLTSEFLNLSIDETRKGFSNLLEFFKGNSLADLEKEREQKEFNKDMLAALQDLKPPPIQETREEKEIPELGFGKLALVIGAAVGALIGAIQAQVKLIANFIKAISPTKWIDGIRRAITSFTAGLSMQFDLFKNAVTKKLTSVTKFITGVLDDILKFFRGSSSGITTISNFFSGLAARLGTIFRPFMSAFELMSKAIAPVIQTISGFFQGIVKTLTNFAKYIGMVSGVVAKIAYPLLVIMAVWDSVKGAYEGYQKEGIVGIFSGAIKGLFNSIIFAPLDMLKNATAWILGKFGFDNAKKFLQSFSFEDIFSSVVDTIFSPIEAVKKLMEGVAEFFKGIGNQITGFFKDFEIPSFSIFGKQLGPWKPFSNIEIPQAAPAMIGQSAAPGMAAESGQSLQTVAQERAALAAVPDRGTGGGSGAGGVMQNNNTTVVNNQTTVVRPIPSATRRPNNSEDVFYGTFGMMGA